MHTLRFFSHRVGVLPCLRLQSLPACLSTLVLATAFSTSAQANDLEHIVVPGDTLEHLARQYLGSAARWPFLLQHNQVRDPKRLQPGSVVRIPWNALPLGQAHVTHVQGKALWSASPQVTTAHLTRSRLAETAEVQAGTTIAEGSLLAVADESFVSVQLVDGTVVRIQGPADVQWSHIRRKGQTGSAQSSIELRKGQMDTSVPARPSAPARFEIRSPLATTSVRGTRFDVQVTNDGNELTSVLEGAVQSHPNRISDSTQVHAGYGIVRAAQGGDTSPQTLLPAPTTPNWLIQTHAQWLSLPLPVLPSSAQGFLVSVMEESATGHTVRQATTTASMSEIRWRAVDDGDYTVRLRVIDQQGLAGLPTDVALTVKAHPIPPLSRSPQHQSFLPVGHVSLQCTDSPEADIYQLELSQDAGFERVLAAHQSRDCQWLTDPLAEGTYFWRVASIRSQANDRPDQGPYGIVQQFLLRERPAQPSTENMQSDVQGALQLRWQATEGMNYRIQIASDEHFSSPIADSWLETPQWTPGRWPRGTYFARLLLRDAQGIESNFSQPWRFTWEGQGVRISTGEALVQSSGDPVDLSH